MNRLKMIFRQLFRAIHEIFQGWRGKEQNHNQGIKAPEVPESHRGGTWTGRGQPKLVRKMLRYRTRYHGRILFTRERRIVYKAIARSA